LTKFVSEIKTTLTAANLWKIPSESNSLAELAQLFGCCRLTVMNSRQYTLTYFSRARITDSALQSSSTYRAAIEQVICRYRRQTGCWQSLGAADINDLWRQSVWRQAHRSVGLRLIVRKRSSKRSDSKSQSRRRPLTDRSTRPHPVASTQLNRTPLDLYTGHLDLQSKNSSVFEPDVHLSSAE